MRHLAIAPMWVVALRAVAAMLCAGCGGASDPSMEDAAAVPDAATHEDSSMAGDATAARDASPDATPEPPAQHRQYVVNQILMPGSASEVPELGLNVDGDPMGRVDNALGGLVAVLSEAEAGVNDFDRPIAGGEIILLLDLRASDLANTPDARLGVFRGANPSTTPCLDDTDASCGQHLDGMTSFEIAPGSPTDSVLSATIMAGSLRAGPGVVRLLLTLVPETEPVEVELAGARVEVASVGADQLVAGRIGGALTESEVSTVLLPEWYERVDVAISRDCTDGGCEPGSTGEAQVDAFDQDGDGSVAFEEFRNSGVISAYLTPDVDLFDTTGAFVPRSDGVKDAVSVGCGFSAVGASFPSPH